MDTPTIQRALLAGHFSTVGDIESLQLVRRWLEADGIACDLAPFAESVRAALASAGWPNRVCDPSRVDPAVYRYLVVICGPVWPQQLARLGIDLEKFRHCVKIGINLTLLAPVADWNPFDVLIERDSDRLTRPDLTLLQETPSVPVVGRCLVHKQSSYAGREHHQRAGQLFTELARRRGFALLDLDTRWYREKNSLQTPTHFFSALQRTDLLLTNRLHGMVYAIKAGVPVVAIDAVAFEHWSGRRHFEAVAKDYGLWPRCCLIYKKGAASYGMPFAEAVKVAKACDLLLTRSGQISRVPELFENARCRVYIDGNPGDTQVRLHQEGAEYEALGRYHHRFTMGLNIGSDVCPIPASGYRWLPVCRPVVLPMWPDSRQPPAYGFTTISSWKGRSSFRWAGDSSGEKADNWLSVIALPQLSGQTFEIALRMAGGQASERGLFTDNGWRLSDPARLQTLADYRRYIGRSRAEFSVAHNRYVKFCTGWFSDRSALYLASGRPVLVQSTGAERHLPVGRGLLTYTSLDEALAGVEAINRDYPAHCRAARAIAESYFDADKVLARLLDQIG